MALQIGERDEDAVFTTINTTPLVDVMLVLLIIFLITIPAVTTSIKLQLPKERVEVRETQPGDIVISVNAGGQIFWFDTPVPDAAALAARLKDAARRTPPPAVHIRADQQARYEGVGRVLYACQTSGLTKVSFITEPPAPASH